MPCSAGSLPVVMLACTGQVTQGKLGVSSAISPPAVSRRRFRITATSFSRRAGIDRRMTGLAMAASGRFFAAVMLSGATAKFKLCPRGEGFRGCLRLFGIVGPRIMGFALSPLLELRRGIKPAGRRLSYSERARFQRARRSMARVSRTPDRLSCGPFAALRPATVR